MAYCKKCSRVLPEGSEICQYCGHENNKTNDIIPSSSRVLFMLLSVFVAPAGIIVGCVYMAKDLKEYREFGRTMLIVSLISIVLFIICCCGFYMFFVNNLMDSIVF